MRLNALCGELRSYVGIGGKDHWFGCPHIFLGPLLQFIGPQPNASRHVLVQRIPDLCRFLVYIDDEMSDRMPLALQE